MANTYLCFEITHEYLDQKVQFLCYKSYANSRLKTLDLYDINVSLKDALELTRKQYKIKETPENLCFVSPKPTVISPYFSHIATNSALISIEL